MIAEYMTKTLTGGKFKLFRDRIMNLSGKHHRIEQQECVGRKLSVSNEHESNESNESTMKRDSLKEKNDAPKKRVVTWNERTQMTGNVPKEPVPKTENVEDAVPQRELSKVLTVKAQK